MENFENELNKVEKLPKHTHNGIDSPKVDVALTDVLTPQAAPSSPVGGITIDAEARTAINSIISKLQTIGIFT